MSVIFLDWAPSSVSFYHTILKFLNWNTPLKSNPIKSIKPPLIKTKKTTPTNPTKHTLYPKTEAQQSLHFHSYTIGPFPLCACLLRSPSLAYQIKEPPTMDHQSVVRRPFCCCRTIVHRPLCRSCRIVMADFVSRFSFIYFPILLNPGFILLSLSLSLPLLSFTVCYFLFIRGRRMVSSSPPGSTLGANGNFTFFIIVGIGNDVCRCAFNHQGMGLYYGPKYSYLLRRNDRYFVDDYGLM